MGGTEWKIFEKLQEEANEGFLVAWKKIRGIIFREI
jgi:hypothetical protein